ncbi:MAG: hypothetical protein V4587_02755, partial [Acidobacteriota bacterium]
MELDPNDQISSLKRLNLPVAVCLIPGNQFAIESYPWIAVAPVLNDDRWVEQRRVVRRLKYDMKFPVFGVCLTNHYKGALG